MTDIFDSLTDEVIPDDLTPSSLFRLEGRVALVTGAAGGLGTWVCAGLAAAGATVAATDRDGPGLEAAHAKLGKHRGRSSTHVADLTTVPSMHDLVGECVRAHGRLDVLVNCAATNRRQPFIEVDQNSFDTIIGVDLRMPFFLSQAAAHAMESSGGGSIVHVTSTNARFGLQSTSVYGAAKAGLDQLVRAMAVELAPRQVRVNAVAPGFLMTPLSKPLWEDAAKRDWILRRVPLARPGTPRELVAVFQLLCSAAGSFLTGQTIIVDGGFLAGNDWTLAGLSRSDPPP